LNLFVVCFFETPTRAALEAFKALLADALVDGTTIEKGRGSKGWWKGAVFPALVPPPIKK
jgi:hypothetical protein